MRTLATIVLLSIAVACCSFAIDGIDILYRTNRVEGTATKSMAMRDSIVYVGDERGVTVYAIRGDTVSFVNEIPHTDLLPSIDIHQDNLYVAYFEDPTLRRYDITDPTHPVQIDSLSWRNCRSFFITDDYLFVHEEHGEPGNCSMTCHILDPLDFSVEYREFDISYGSYSLNYMNDQRTFMNRIHQDYTNTLCLFDVSDIENIEPICEIELGTVYIRAARTITHNDNMYLYLAADYDGFLVYDITDLDNPVPIWSTEGRTYNLQIQDTIAWVMFRGELVGINIEDPGAPWVQYEQTMRSAEIIACEGDMVATGGAYLTVSEVQNGALNTVAQTVLDGRLIVSDYDGERLYLGTEHQSLVQLDLHDFSQPPARHSYVPVERGWYGDVVSYADSVVCFMCGVYADDAGTIEGHLETLLYRLGEDGLLHYFTHVDSTGNQWFAHLRNGRELFAGQDGQVYRYGISSEGCQLLEQLALPGMNQYDFEFHGDYVYVSDWQNGVVLLAPEGEPMQQVGTFATPMQADRFRAVFFGDYMFVSGNFSFVNSATSVFDISDPAHPVHLMQLEAYGSLAVDAQNELLFAGQEHCLVYDLSRLTDEGVIPPPVGSFTSSDWITDYYPLPGSRMLCVDGTGVFLMHYSHVQSADSDTAPAPGLALIAAPNPFNPETTLRFTLAQPGPVRLEVYNIRGQRVRTLLHQPMPAGNHYVQWDGRDDTGRPAASGVYFARVRSARQSQTTKLLLLK